MKFNSILGVMLSICAKFVTTGDVFLLCRIWLVTAFFAVRTMEFCCVSPDPCSGSGYETNTHAHIHAHIHTHIHTHTHTHTITFTRKLFFRWFILLMVVWSVLLLKISLQVNSVLHMYSNYLVHVWVGLDVCLSWKRIWKRLCCYKNI